MKIGRLGFLAFCKMLNWFSVLICEIIQSRTQLHAPIRNTQKTSEWMNTTRSTRSLTSSNTLSIKHASLLISTWVLTGALLIFSRATHPAFGVQGDLPIHYHITRIYERSLSEGDIFPRWAGLLDGGRGDTLFTFYPPISYLLSVIIMKLLRIDALEALKVTTLLALILAQCGSYVFARQFFDRRKSLLCSLTYVLLPAYPLIALHRGFIANAVALSLVPMALLGASQLLSGERRARGFAIFATCFSALIMTHAITTYLCAAAVVLMTLIYLPYFGWRAIARLAGAGLVILALTAFILWPQVVEADWVQIGLPAVQQNYRDYFLFAKSPDESRYRLGWADFNYVASMITIAQTVMALSLGILCLRFLSAKRSSTGLAAIARFGVVLAAFGIIISLPISDIIWRYAPGLKFVQFPWRFQPFVALGCGLLMATAYELWPSLNPKLRVIVSAFLTWNIIACVIFTILLVRLGESDVTRAETREILSVPNGKPITVEEWQKLLDAGDKRYTAFTANESYFRPIVADSYMYPPASEPGGLSIVSGRGRVVSQKLNMERREFLIEIEEPARARIDTYHYPHWVARLDGREVEIKSEDGSGLMLIDLPAGRVRLTIDYEVRQLSQRIAKAVSSVAWAGFLIWLIARVTKRREQKRDKTQ